MFVLEILQNIHKTCVLHTHTHTYERRIVSEDTCIHHESEDTSYLKILTHRNMFSSNPYNFEEYSCMSFF